MEWVEVLGKWERRPLPHLKTKKNVGMPWRGCSFKSCLLGLPHYKEGSLEVQEGMILIANIFDQSFHHKPWSLAYVLESEIPYTIAVNSEWSELILNNVRIFATLGSYACVWVWVWAGPTQWPKSGPGSGSKFCPNLTLKIRKTKDT
jgi:hypothetical protein